MDFNPHKNIICSISKNAILLTNIKNLKKSKRIPNFQYFKSEKPYGIMPNLNHCKLIYFKFFQFFQFLRFHKKQLLYLRQNLSDLFNRLKTKTNQGPQARVKRDEELHQL
jgi:hypothetical protein